MRGVVAAVPRIEREKFLDRPFARFRVAELALKVRVREGFEQDRPAQVNAFENSERNVNRKLAVGKFRPKVFVILPDQRIVFGHRQFETAQRIDVRIGDVMNRLPHRPAFGTMARVKLFVR